MTIARATVFYCILCGRRKERAAVVCVMTQHHRQKLTQQCRQNNNMAKQLINQTNTINDYGYEYN